MVWILHNDCYIISKEKNDEIIVRYMRENIILRIIGVSKNRYRLLAVLLFYSFYWKYRLVARKITKLDGNSVMQVMHVVKNDFN